MADVIAYKYVKTRKPHKCFGCAREYPKGSILNREAVVDGGTVFTAYMCSECEDYLHSSRDYRGEEFGFGDLYESVMEYRQTRQEKGRM